MTQLNIVIHSMWYVCYEPKTTTVFHHFDFEKLWNSTKFHVKTSLHIWMCNRMYWDLYQNLIEAFKLCTFRIIHLLLYLSRWLFAVDVSFSLCFSTFIGNFLCVVWCILLLLLGIYRLFLFFIFRMITFWIAVIYSPLNVISKLYTQHTHIFFFK